MSLRITMADDHRITRIGLKTILEQEACFELVGESDTALGALAMVKLLQPDVAIIDLNLPDGSGLSVVPAMHSASPGTRILVLTMHAEADIVRRALAAGVHGYVSKEAEPEEVLSAIRAVGAGRSFLSVALKPEGLSQLEPPPESVAERPAKASPGRTRLSMREQQVLVLFVEGRTQREIAERLGLRLKTVETYRARLGDKLGVRSRAELVRCAREMQLVPQA